LAGLEEALVAHTAVGVDTAPFIYLWERHPQCSPLSEALFRPMTRPEARGITSISTLRMASGSSASQVQ